ncbi:MAG: lipopolysaccharide biosynthesis protein, partial [bacterium]
MKEDNNGELLNNEGSMSHRVMRGGMWVFGLNITCRLLSFVRIIVLARLLAPDDFGLFGITMLALSVIETFSQPGIQNALIQKKDNTEEYLNTAWMIMMIRGVILFSILYISAPFVASYFKTPPAATIIRVLAVAKLFAGFSNIAVVYFQKELEFNKQFVYLLTITVFEVTVSILAAVILRNVWALVYGVIAGSISGLVLSYIIHPFRPKFVIDWKKAKELFGFGKWLLWSEILLFLILQGDDLFVAKMLGASVLGLYQMAYNIANLPTTDITRMVTRVTFPAYSKIQDNIQRLKESYLRVVQLVAFLSFPLSGAIFILAHDFTKIFLGEKWLSIVPVLQVLVFAGLVRSIMATIGPVFLAAGKPRIDTKWQLIRLLVLITLIYWFTVKWGMVGTAVAVVASNVAATAGFFYDLIRVLKITLIKLAK